MTVKRFLSINLDRPLRYASGFCLVGVLLAGCVLVALALWGICSMTMADDLKQSTAAYVLVGKFVSTTDGITAVTSIPTNAQIFLSINGGALTTRSAATSSVHAGGGYMRIPLSTADTATAGNLDVVVVKTGCLEVHKFGNRVLVANAHNPKFTTALAAVNTMQVEGADATDTVQASANAALVAQSLDHLCAVATGAADMTTEVVDNSILSRILANGDTSAFVPSTDGLQPIRDRGDAAWVTATGFSTHAAADVKTALEADGSKLDTFYDDWLNGGRLGLILDTIAADVAGLDGAAMRGTDSAALAATALSTATWTAEKAGFLTGDAYVRLGAPAGASISADVAAVKAVVDAILVDTGTDGVVVAAGSKTGYALSATGADLITKTSTFALALADAFCDEALSGHTTAGTVGKALSDAGSAADPWSTSVPGDYAAGTAGALFARLGTASITVSSPVATDGEVTIYRGDDYKDADGRALQFTVANYTGPSLAGATTSFYLIPRANYERGDGTAALTVTATVTGTTTLTVKVELTATQTAALAAVAEGKGWNYRYQIRSVTSTTRKLTLAEGEMTVYQDVPTK